MAQQIGCREREWLVLTLARRAPDECQVTDASLSEGEVAGLTTGRRHPVCPLVPTRFCNRTGR
jgi:hypothetical protein